MEVKGRLKTTYIYGIFNKQTKRWYVGQSIHPASRFKEHMQTNTKMMKDKERYGEDSFEAAVFVECPLCWAGECERAWHDCLAMWFHMYNRMRPTVKSNVHSHYFKPEDWEKPKPKSWKKKELLPQFFIEHGERIADRCIPT